MKPPPKVIFFAAGVAMGSGAFSSEALPPRTPRPLAGVHAYAAPSVRAGETMDFHVSASADYRFSLVRLGPDPHSSEADLVLHSEASPPRPHPIHPGSYVHVGISPVAQGEAFSLSCWVRPFRVDGARQAVASQWRDDAPGGWALFLEDGRFALACGAPGEGEVATQAGTARCREWQHLVISVLDGEAAIWLDGRLAAREAFAAGRTGAAGDPAPLRLGAAGGGALAAYFLDGDLADIALFSGALDSAMIRGLHEARGLRALEQPKPLAHWRFTEEQGEVAGDATGSGFDGRIINNGTWMIGGPSFDAAKVGRFDTSYHPSSDPRRGHGLRLAADDLYDCGWPVAHRVVIPEDSPSGFYCGRFEYEEDGRTLEHNVTFVVRAPASRKRRAPILVLAATNTWRAYNWFPFGRTLQHGRHPWGQADVAARNPDHDLPAFSHYRDHQAGQPTYMAGLRLPCPSADPYRTYRGHEFWGQWVANERLVHLWLDRHGHDYEVIADADLDADPDQLRDRKVLFITGHSEYWSDPAYDAVERYLDGGGQVIVLSANTMFWRVDLSTPGILECRKLGPGIRGGEWTEPGEIYHGPGKARGGLMRFCGRPAWRLIGLETAGWCEGMDFLPFTATRTSHPFFTHPHPVAVAEGAEFGFFRGIGMVGHEYDARPGILVKATPEMPTGHAGVADPPGIRVLAECRSGRRILDYLANENLASENPSGVIAEIIDWQRPRGGRVFNIGSVAAPWGLYYDERVGNLVRNVLHHFGLPE